MYSTSHISAIVILLLSLSSLFLIKNKLSVYPNRRQYERWFAVCLLITELGYHILYYLNGQWKLSYSLPIELCSFSLFASILLLWTRDKRFIDFVFFAGIAGALQAIFTPVIDYGFPHFRFFHFFLTHSGIILTAFYFMWVKGYYPTFKGIVKTMFILNLLLPLVFVINYLVDGNYMFLSRKPSTNSLLDVLGPYPWYILSMEFVAFMMFIVLWVVFRKKRVNKKEFIKESGQ